MNDMAVNNAMTIHGRHLQPTNLTKYPECTDKTNTIRTNFLPQDAHKNYFKIGCNNVLIIMEQSLFQYNVIFV